MYCALSEILTIDMQQNQLSQAISHNNLNDSNVISLYFLLF